MSNTTVSNNGVNEAGVYIECFSYGRCPVVRTRGPGRHKAAVQKKWSTEDDIVRTCYCQCHLQSWTKYLEQNRETQ